MGFIRHIYQTRIYLKNNGPDMDARANIRYWVRTYSSEGCSPALPSSASAEQDKGNIDYFINKINLGTASLQVDNFWSTIFMGGHTDYCLLFTVHCKPDLPQGSKFKSHLGRPVNDRVGI